MTSPETPLSALRTHDNLVNQGLLRATIGMPRLSTTPISVIVRAAPDRPRSSPKGGPTESTHWGMICLCSPGDLGVRRLVGGQHPAARRTRRPNGPHASLETAGSVPPGLAVLASWSLQTWLALLDRSDLRSRRCCFRTVLYAHVEPRTAPGESRCAQDEEMLEQARLLEATKVAAEHKLHGQRTRWRLSGRWSRVTGARWSGPRPRYFAARDRAFRGPTASDWSRPQDDGGPASLGWHAAAGCCW